MFAGRLSGQLAPYLEPAAQGGRDRRHPRATLVFPEFELLCLLHHLGVDVHILDRGVGRTGRTYTL